MAKKTMFLFTMVQIWICVYPQHENADGNEWTR
jgi:hypothetical protein